jgi:hypothetical protein
MGRPVRIRDKRSVGLKLGLAVLFLLFLLLR